MARSRRPSDGHVAPEDVPRILLPSALRRALPQYSNEVITMLQTTSAWNVHRHPGGHHRRRADRLHRSATPPFEAFITAGLFTCA